MAANDYVKLWIEDYKLLLEPYSMEERGRIIWAMILILKNQQATSTTAISWKSEHPRIDALNKFV